MDNPIVKVDMDNRNGYSAAQSFIVADEDKKKKSKKQQEDAEKSKNKKTAVMADKFVSEREGKPLINIPNHLKNRLKDANIDLPTEKDSITQLIQKINKIDKLLKEEQEHPVYSYFRKHFKKDMVAKNLATITNLINPYKHNNLNINPFVSFEKNKKED
jgi:seryl-tRNA synthetase